jgi:putative transposase
MFALEIRRKQVDTIRSLKQWCWHLDEAFVKINGAPKLPLAGR